jgi:hypothetical protein
MEQNKEQIDRIEQALSTAHREQTASDLSPEWRRDVMRDVRRLHAQTLEGGRRHAPTLVFRRMILPFAAATGLVAVALTAYLLTAVPGMEQDLFAVLTEDPSGLLATQELGL